MNEKISTAFLPALVTSKFVAVKTASQTISDSVNTVVTFPNTIDSADISYSSGTFTVNSSGYYLISSHLSWDNNATGNRILWIESSSTKYGIISNSGTISRLSSTSVVKFSSGATFDIRCFQNSGGNLNITATDQNYVCVIKLF